LSFRFPRDFDKCVTKIQKKDTEKVIFALGGSSPLPFSLSLSLSLLLSQRGIVIETHIERSGRVVPIDGIDKKANALSII